MVPPMIPAMNAPAPWPPPAFALAGAIEARSAAATSIAAAFFIFATSLFHASFRRVEPRTAAKCSRFNRLTSGMRRLFKDEWKFEERLLGGNDEDQHPFLVGRSAHEDHPSAGEAQGRGQEVALALHDLHGETDLVPGGRGRGHPHRAAAGKRKITRLADRQG